MHLRQRASRYSTAVLALAGINAALIITAFILDGMQAQLSTALGAVVVASLILHARAGFALSRAQQEIEMLRRETKKVTATTDIDKILPKISLDAKRDISNDDAQILHRVKSAIEHDRVDLYLQPIVSLPQRRYRFFEAFSRLRNDDGSVLRPVSYLEAAERANKIGAIDNLILLRAVQALRNLDGARDRIFCNISPATIFDNDFFARFIDYLDANADLAPKIVFEFTYPAVEIMGREIGRNLEEIADRGYAFSVDHVNRFDLNWRDLRDRNFRYVKCASSLLLTGGSGARPHINAFKDRLAQLDMDLIVEKVERESDMPEILTMGIDYGQGELFGAPRPASFYIRPELRLAKAS